MTEFFQHLLLRRKEGGNQSIYYRIWSGHPMDEFDVMPENPDQKVEGPLGFLSYNEVWKLVGISDDTFGINSYMNSFGYSSEKEFRGKKILDIGSGFGVTTIEILGTHTADIYCINPLLPYRTKQEHDFLRRHALGWSNEFRGFSISEQKIDELELEVRRRTIPAFVPPVPFSDRQFDIVWAHLSIGLTNPILLEIARVLKKGGEYRTNITIPDELRRKNSEDLSDLDINQIPTLEDILSYVRSKYPVKAYLKYIPSYVDRELGDFAFVMTK